ncbi:MAG: tail fiber protein [Nitrococcus sp.]|nr:tail fiber protein [Nitrococcus sp.]
MSEVILGQVVPVAFGFAPRGFALCDGQLLSIAQNSALFALLGTQYGGDGKTTFALPDLRGRTPVGYGSSTLGDVPIGETAGAETVTLTAAELPAHVHQSNGTTAAGGLRNPTGALYGAATAATYAPAASGSQVTLNAQTLAAVGQGQAHENMQPFCTVNFCIAITGIFPSRN